MVVFVAFYLLNRAIIGYAQFPLEVIVEITKLEIY